MDRQRLFTEARQALGLDHLVLGIHDASFPSAPQEELGRGSPYSRGARDFLSYALDLGFTGVQLGPQGETTSANASPYDGTVFAKSVLSIDLMDRAFDDEGQSLFDDSLVEHLLSAAPRADGRAHLSFCAEAHERVISEAFARFEEGRLPRLAVPFEDFRVAHRVWLEHDCEYRARAALHARDDWRSWPDDCAPLDAASRRVAERYAFAQFLAHRQHGALRAWCRSTRLKLSGDLQVGLSHVDRWRRGALFLPDYLLGAPPSTTEPNGQPWGYPVLDPASAPAAALLALRVTKMLHEFDGLRVDHPQGLVCPWVYDAHAVDPFDAVTNGARLFASPGVPEHPALAQYAIARSDQIDRRVGRDADGWVKALDAAQVELYGRRFDILINAARDVGRSQQDIACEVLSTLPYPLSRVMDRHGLGRFRVTQKANPKNPGYRSENAAPNDWIMVGTHDTPPLAQVLAAWRHEGSVGEHAQYLARRLVAEGASREAFATELCASDGALAQAMFADLLASPARNVMIFFADVLGLPERYNRPGIVDDVNWTLRVPNDFRAVHRRNTERGVGMNVERAFALALRAKAPARLDLIDALVGLDTAQSTAVEP